jgi:hypothetical protein
MDPATRLATSTFAERGLRGAEAVRIAEIEYRESEVNTFGELARSGRLAVSLSETDGDLRPEPASSRAKSTQRLRRQLSVASGRSAVASAWARHAGIESIASAGASSTTRRRRTPASASPAPSSIAWANTVDVVSRSSR